MIGSIKGLFKSKKIPRVNNFRSYYLYDINNVHNGVLCGMLFTEAVL